MGRRSKFRFFPVIMICIAFALLSFALIGQQYYGTSSQDNQVPILSIDNFQSGGQDEESSFQKDCLVLINSSEEYSVLAEEDIRALFGQLKVDADFVDVSIENIPSLNNYTKVVTALVEYSVLGERAYDLMDWVFDGGGLMVYFPPQGDLFFRALGAQMGIQESGWAMYETTGIRLKTDLLLGGQGKDFFINESFESSLTLDLTSDCIIHIVSANERELPILWERQHGDGRIVFMNFGIMGKAYRGIYAAAYSLLFDAFCWPVINASSFYLDDFPSPVPAGTNAYNEKDYGMNISDFYINIWWPDLLELAEKYGIRYSGMIIENYSEELEAPFEVNMNTQRYSYFGSDLLQNGGEIGLHGYNHVPLCLENFETEVIGETGLSQSYEYDYWKSKENMRASMEELVRFTSDLFPDATLQVYAPPANILSADGRQMLVEDFPQIKAIAGVYTEGNLGYAQEFEVAADGIIEIPRIISGLVINPFMEISALSELNLHYVNSHYQTPDEVMDADYNAQAGWESMKEHFTEYLDWLYTSAPDIRNLTASEMAGAVQRYYYLDVEQEVTEDEIILDLTNFQDEAFLFLRINERPPEDPETCITGGTLQDMGGGLYLVTATADHIVIERGDA